MENTLKDNKSTGIEKQKRYNKNKEHITAVNLNKTDHWFMKKLYIGKIYFYHFRDELDNRS